MCRLIVVSEPKRNILLMYCFILDFRGVASTNPFILIILLPVPMYW